MFPRITRFTRMGFGMLWMGLLWGAGGIGTPILAQQTGGFYGVDFKDGLDFNQTLTLADEEAADNGPRPPVEEAAGKKDSGGTGSGALGSAARDVWLMRGVPENLRQDYLEAFSELEKKENKRAFWRFDKLIDVAPAVAVFYHGRGLAHMALGRREFALDDYGRAMQLDPQNADFHHTLARDSFQRQEYAAAALRLSRVVALDPDRAEAWFTLGLAQAQNADWKDAYNSFSRVVGLTPHAAQPWYNRGFMAARMGLYEEALADINRAFSVDHAPANPARSHYTRGLVYAAINRIPQALADFNQAERLGYRAAPLYYNRGNINYLAGKYKNALDDYNRAVKLHAAYGAALHNRGYTWLTLRHWGRAESDFSQTVAVDPGFEEAWFNRGYARLMQHKDQGAQDDFQRVLQITPQRGEGWFNRGVAGFFKKEMGEACPDFEAACTLGFQPGCAMNQKHCGPNRLDQREFPDEPPYRMLPWEEDPSLIPPYPPGVPSDHQPSDHRPSDQPPISPADPGSPAGEQKGPEPSTPTHAKPGSPSGAKTPSGTATPAGKPERSP